MSERKINRDLTGKMRRFASLVASGLSGAEAYRQAYDTKGKPDTIYSEASRLLTDPRITARVRELWSAQDAEMIEDGVALRRHVIGRLLEESDRARNPNPSARIKSLELLGKLDIVRLFSEPPVCVSETRTAEELERDLLARLQEMLRQEEPIS